MGQTLEQGEICLIYRSYRMSKALHFPGVCCSCLRKCPINKCRSMYLLGFPIYHLPHYGCNLTPPIRPHTDRSDDGGLGNCKMRGEEYSTSRLKGQLICKRAQMPLGADLY